MPQPTHRIIGVIRIEPPVADISGGEEDDSTIGGLLARFAQRSLLSDGSREPWWTCAGGRRSRLDSRGGKDPRVQADLDQLTEDLEDEFTVLSDAGV